MALYIHSRVKTYLTQFRSFNTSSVVNSEISKPTETTGASRTINPKLGLHRVTVTPFYRRLLVFSKKYKSISEVPDEISVEVLEKARSRARVKLANYLMLLTILGCLGFAYSGRKAAERGESVVKMNQEWHKDYNDKVAAEAKKK